MPALKNQRHERFCMLVQSRTQTDAYCEAGFKCTRSAARRLATRLMTRADIRSRLAELQSKIEEKVTASAALTREWVLERLMRNAAITMGEEKIKAIAPIKSRVKDETGGYSEEIRTTEIEVTDRDATAANRALELLGRERGMFIDRKEIGEPGDFADMTDDELRDKIRGADKAGGSSPRRRGTPRPPAKANLLH